MPKLAVNVPVLTCKQRDDGWWIIGMPSPDCPECGPYRTRAEADEDRMGLQRYFRDRDSMLRAAAPPKGFEYRRDALGGVRMVKIGSPDVVQLAAPPAATRPAKRSTATAGLSPMKLLAAVESLPREKLLLLLGVTEGPDDEALREQVFDGIDGGKIKQADVTTALET